MNAVNIISFLYGRGTHESTRFLRENSEFSREELNTMGERKNPREPIVYTARTWDQLDKLLECCVRKASTKKKGETDKERSTRCDTVKERAGRVEEEFDEAIDPLLDLVTSGMRPVAVKKTAEGVEVISSAWGIAGQRLSDLLPQGITLVVGARRRQARLNAEGLSHLRSEETLLLIVSDDYYPDDYQQPTSSGPAALGDLYVPVSPNVVVMRATAAPPAPKLILVYQANALTDTQVRELVEVVEHDATGFTKTPRSSTKSVQGYTMEVAGLAHPRNRQSPPISMNAKGRKADNGGQALVALLYLHELIKRLGPGLISHLKIVLLIGGVFAAMARSENFHNTVHLDEKDVALSTWIIYRLEGTGTLTGNHFVLPGLGIAILPGHGSVVGLDTSTWLHGTAMPTVEGTISRKAIAAYTHLEHITKAEQAVRLGSSVVNALMEGPLAKRSRAELDVEFAMGGVLTRT